MQITPTALKDVYLLEPKVFGDARGFFFESYNHQEFCQQLNLNVCFVQDNHSRSTQNVLRGLHYQVIQPQGKLVRVVSGTIFDVVVDLRQTSPTFGQWAGHELSADNQRQLWIPVGFAHGFLVRSESAEVLYKTTDYYCPGGDRTLLWNDPDLGISWPLYGEPMLSAKDQIGTRLKDAELFS